MLSARPKSTGRAARAHLDSEPTRQRSRTDHSGTDITPQASGLLAAAPIDQDGDVAPVRGRVPTTAKVATQAHPIMGATGPTPDAQPASPAAARARGLRR